MPKVNSFSISRSDLRKVLRVFKVSEKDINLIINGLEKSHRHINIVIFVSLLERAGLSLDQVSNIMRRFGIDDVTISRSIELVDEEKILVELGRIYNVELKE